MNNYQENNNTNPQTDNNQFNQQRFIINENQPLNVIPASINSQDNLTSQTNGNYFNTETKKNTEQNQIVNTNIINNNQDNYFTNNTVNFNQNYQQENNQNEDINAFMGKESNKFINNNIDTNSTSLNNLNIEGEYNNIPKVDYSKDPKVMENMQRKNTITITSEGKVFIIIIVVLLLFVFVLPTIFDFITNISYS